MISEAWLQILLILAYLAVGLIAVTFPIYAICVVYLRQEKREGEKEQKQQKTKLKNRIQELTKKLDEEAKGSKTFLEIQQQIQISQRELDGIQKRYESLTAKGVVGKPVIILSLALLSTSLGLNFYYLDQEAFFVFVAGAVILLGIAVIRLYKTLSTIELAALRVLRTVGCVFHFGKLGVDSCEIEQGKETEIKIGGGSDEEGLDEYSLNAFFPPEIEVVRAVSPKVSVAKQTEGFQYPNYTMVSFSDRYLSISTSIGIRIMILATKKGMYEIPVRMDAREIKSCDGKLTLKVV